MIDLMFFNIFFSAPYLAYHPTYRKLLILSFTVVTHTMFSGPISCYNTIIPKVKCKKYSAKTLQFLSISIINPTIRFPEIDMDWGSGINASSYKKSKISLFHYTFSEKSLARFQTRFMNLYLRLHLLLNLFMLCQHTNC